VYGVNNAEDKKDGVSLEFSRDYLQVPPGKYVLCYISRHKGWLRGISNEFEVSKQLSGLDFIIILSS